MAHPQLPKLSPKLLAGSAAARPSIDGDCPALLSLANLRLCCATRSQVNQLAPVELALLRALEPATGQQSVNAPELGPLPMEELQQGSCCCESM
jgi:hypothetical protein